MNNTINGRTPEEIKRGLECQDCRNCTYDGHNFKDGESRCHEAADDAVALIDKLLESKKQLERERDEARNDLDTLNYATTELHSAYDAMERERDAAVEQLKEVDRGDLFRCSHCIHDELCNDGLTSCIDCDKDCSCHTCKNGSNWQWRGVQEVE